MRGRDRTLSIKTLSGVAVKCPVRGMEGRFHLISVDAYGDDYGFRWEFASALRVAVFDTNTDGKKPPLSYTLVKKGFGDIDEVQMIGYFYSNASLS